MKLYLYRSQYEDKPSPDNLDQALNYSQQHMVEFYRMQIKSALEFRAFDVIRGINTVECRITGGWVQVRDVRLHQ